MSYWDRGEPVTDRRPVCNPQGQGVAICPGHHPREARTWHQESLSTPELPSPPSEWIQCVMCHAVSEESCLGSETHKDICGKSQGETHAVGEGPATGPGGSSPYLICNADSPTVIPWHSLSPELRLREPRKVS